MENEIIELKEENKRLKKENKQFKWEIEQIIKLVLSNRETKSDFNYERGFEEEYYTYTGCEDDIEYIAELLEYEIAQYELENEE